MLGYLIGILTSFTTTLTYIYTIFPLISIFFSLYSFISYIATFESYKLLPALTADGWETASLQDVGLNPAPITNIYENIAAEASPKTKDV